MICVNGRRFKRQQSDQREKQTAAQRPSQTTWTERSVFRTDRNFFICSTRFLNLCWLQFGKNKHLKSSIVVFISCCVIIIVIFHANMVKQSELSQQRANDVTNHKSGVGPKYLNVFMNKSTSSSGWYRAWYWCPANRFQYFFITNVLSNMWVPWVTHTPTSWLEVHLCQGTSLSPELL